MSEDDLQRFNEAASEQAMKSARPVNSIQIRDHVDLVPGGARVSAQIYELQLDRVRARAELAVLARLGNEDGATAARARLADTEEALRRATAVASELPMDRVAQRLALSDREVDFAWTAVAAAVDPTLTPQLRAVAGAEIRRGLSLALYAVVAGAATADIRALALTLTPLHPLLHYGLLACDSDALAATRAYAAYARFAAYLAGDDRLDDAVARLGGVIAPRGDVRFDAAQLEAVRHIRRALAAPEPMVVAVEGPHAAGKRTAASVGAASLGRALVELDARRLPAGLAELDEAVVALRRECFLADALPLIAHVDELCASEGGSSPRMRALARLVDDTPLPFVVTSTRAGIDLETTRAVQRIRMPVPGGAAREELWRDAFAGAPGVDIDQLAQRYRLGAGGIRRAAEAARLVAGRDELVTQHAVEGVRRGIAERLGELAQRLEVTQRWDDLVLPEDTLDQIRALCARVRHGHLVHERWGFGAKLPRGLGTTALFSGPPGTGKTMVAGLIARELNLELYQVDLSKVVSKWVGETEKQLANIFDAAEAGHALLLFDEADALFARRTDVKGAMDRYANLEVNYLLQRIEAFGGIAILTTNLDASIDPALRRRLAAHVVFEPPERPERATLWERLLDARAPRGDDLDFHELAGDFPDMTGANIRNAVLAAAFLAAAEASPITHDHLARGGSAEYRAMGRIHH